MSQTSAIQAPLDRRAVLPALGALTLLLFNLQQHFAITDDAYISFRYLDNWLSGHGLVFNAGERVEGYTNFLWIVLLAPFRLGGISAETASILLSLAALILLLVAVYQTAASIAGDRLAGLAAVILACGSLPLASWSVSGMETVAFAALLALANQRITRQRAPGAGSSLLFGLAALTRPNGLLHGVSALLASLFDTRRPFADRLRRAVLAGLVLCLLPAAHLLFRWLYYGDWIPNTAHAKIGADLPNLLPAGFNYLLIYLQQGGAVLLSGLLLSLAFAWRTGWLLWSLFLQIALHTAYVLWVGGDFFAFSRFFVPVVPALAVCSAVGLIAFFHSYWPNRQHVALWIAFGAAIAQSMSGYLSQHETLFQTVVEIRKERELIAAWLNDNFDAGTVVAMNAVGLVPYRTGLRTIDMLGLTDAHIARAAAGNPGTTGKRYVGHYRHDGKYVCQRQPDLVFLGGIQLRYGRSVEEAAAQPDAAQFPGDHEFLRLCAQNYRLIGKELKPERFVTAYQRVEDKPMALKTQRSAEDWFRYGLSLMNEATMTRAVEAFRNSLALNPRNPAAKTNLGFALQRLGQLEPALGWFESALADNPEFWDALYGAALVYSIQEDYDKAETTWSRYLDRAPDSPWKKKAQNYLEQVRQKRSRISRE